VGYILDVMKDTFRDHEIELARYRIRVKIGFDVADVRVTQTAGFCPRSGQRILGNVSRDDFTDKAPLTQESLNEALVGS
jgi:hypothetical protein